MLIVTKSLEAMNASRTVRFFLQRQQATDTTSTAPSHFRLVLQLSSRHRVLAAEDLPEPLARALFRDLVRAWTRGQSCFEIGTVLRRIEQGETGGNGRTEVCL